MLVCWIIVTIALTWLLYETDWLRVRLPYGKEPDKLKYKTWAELKSGLLQTKKSDPGWLKFPDICTPLCGWEWLKNTIHIIPENKIVLIREHSKITMQTERMDILRDCFRVWRNPYLKVKLS